MLSFMVKYSLKHKKYKGGVINAQIQCDSNVYRP